MGKSKKFHANDNNLAIAYYRFSSHSQNDASIDQQRELAHTWADTHGYKIIKEYEDAAISGTTEDRPGFRQMLSEVGKIKPHVLILWKTDRLGRDKYILTMAKKTIRDSGCEIRMVAESIPTNVPEGVLIEGFLDSIAEYYSIQLSQNIQRGMRYNAEHALYNGHKLFGYSVDKETKKYITDPITAPFVQRMFQEYAAGKPMQAICDDFNAQGLRTTRGQKFGVKTMAKMLRNRSYIGEYHYADIVIEGGMPALIDTETFEKAQRKLSENKRMGSQKANGAKKDRSPRYWLTGKLFCGNCGQPMHGVSGTSKTKKTYYYYCCSSQHGKKGDGKKCSIPKVRKEYLEGIVLRLLKWLSNESECVLDLAAVVADYYEKNYKDTGYLDALEKQRKETERNLANLLKAIENGIISETVTNRFAELEQKKKSLDEAIQAETVRLSLFEEKHSIGAYFEKFLNANLDDPDVRQMVFEYFVSKIIYDRDTITILSSELDEEYYGRDFSFEWEILQEDLRAEMEAEMEAGQIKDPFVAGETVVKKFYCFPFESTSGKLPLPIRAPHVVGCVFFFARVSHWRRPCLLNPGCAPRLLPLPQRSQKAKGASGASRAGSSPSPFCQPIPFSRFSSKTRFRAAAPSWGSRWNGARHRPTSYPSMATAALITVPEPPY